MVPLGIDTSYLAEPAFSPPLAAHSKLHLPEPPAGTEDKKKKESEKQLKQ